MTSTYTYCAQYITENILLVHVHTISLKTEIHVCKYRIVRTIFIYNFVTPHFQNINKNSKDVKLFNNRFSENITLKKANCSLNVYVCVKAGVMQEILSKQKVSTLIKSQYITVILRWLCYAGMIDNLSE